MGFCLAPKGLIATKLRAFGQFGISRPHKNCALPTADKINVHNGQERLFRLVTVLLHRGTHCCIGCSFRSSVMGALGHYEYFFYKICIYSHI